MDALAFNLQGFLVMHVSVSFFQEGPHLKNRSGVLCIRMSPGGSPGSQCLGN